MRGEGLFLEWSEHKERDLTRGSQPLFYPTDAVKTKEEEKKDGGS
jgi:hypothetical protein